ncbi:Panacea domain-containing protein [Clostridium cagae]|uniref:Panacea domain-containing protein n=1 Tax=Clostridium cagae TaxID=2080751 RepID=UPI003F776E8D
MHTALEIAAYIINKCIELGRPVSNLQLQKILYYVQGKYIKITNGEVLFSDTMEAWQYGPVVPKVYYSYNSYSSSNIIAKQDEIELESFEKDIIDPVIHQKSMYSAWTLVEQSHSEKPWINAYNNGNGSPITNDELRNWFIEN